MRVIFPLYETLSDLMKKADYYFSQQSAIYLAAHTLECIHDVHLHHYYHREICPSNFLIGLGKAHGAILITGFHVAYRYTGHRQARFSP